MPSSPPARARAFIALAIAALSLIPPSARADTGMVVIANRGEYTPGDDSKRVPAPLLHGHDLVFTNRDPLSFGGHTFTSTTGLFDSGVVDVNQMITIPTASLPAGTYHFYCQVHLGMFGTLVIV